VTNVNFFYKFLIHLIEKQKNRNYYCMQFDFWVCEYVSPLINACKRPIFMHKLKELVLDRRARCAYATLANKQRNKQTIKKQARKEAKKYYSNSHNDNNKKANKQTSSYYIRITMKRFCLVMNTHQLHL